MQALRNYLSNLGNGPIKCTPKFEKLLASAWEQFEGHDQHKMSSKKLFSADFGNGIQPRLENIQWNSPILSFKIERHGGTVRGSTRADLHDWFLNLDLKSAECLVESYRQLKPTSQRIDVKSIAQDIVEKMLSGKSHPNTSKRKDGATVILTTKIFPEKSAAKQTVSQRRKRLMDEIEKMLSKAGWEAIGRNAFKPPQTS